MGRREELLAELVLVDAEEAFMAAKAARRENDNPKTLAAFNKARDALTAARAEHRANRPAKPAKAGDATVSPKTVSAKAAAQKGAG
jgi:hypothetical protein